MKTATSPVQKKLMQALELQNKGAPEKARPLFLETLKLDSGNFVALYSLAAIESNASNYTSALSHANRAIAANPSFASSHLARSVIQFHLGRLKEAHEDVTEALRLQPDVPNGREHLKTVSTALALGLTTRSNQADPVAALNMQALKAQERGDTPEAAKIFQQVLEIDVGNFVALYSLGVLANQQGKTQLALSFLNRAVEHNPDNAQGHFALATTLQNMGLFEAALTAFDKALSLNPKYMEAFNNKATLLHSMNRQKDALLTAEAALAVAPDDEKSLCNKGYILTEFKQYGVASSVFKRLLEVNPEFEYAAGLHAYARLHGCDWTDFEANRSCIIEGVRAGKRTCNPLAFMAVSDSAELALGCSEVFGAHRFPTAREPLWKGDAYRHRKKRVAFISADFREHPVGYLLIGVIERFDKTRFETVGISLGIRDGSELYRRYRNGFDHYLDCADKPAIEIARLLRAMEIDIAIDLSGYTSGSRLDILSHRPAPHQMTYLGFPGTLGVPYVDYLIGDPVIITPQLAPHYREKVLCLPHCYLPRDTSVKPAETLPPRSEFGLPDEGVVFCSFNHDYKINPPMFAVWMELLREMPGSVLWLMKLNDDARQNLAKNAEAHGIDPKRIIFATRVPRVEDHLARYRYADVFLDTYPYNGHTTAGDALLSGVPVVTLSGTSFASRVARSLLHDVGLEGALACDSLEQYKQVAIAMVSPGQARDDVRARLKAALESRWPIDLDRQAQAMGDVLGMVG